jgi:hypothetical protein
MPFDNRYPNRKDHREPYRGAKRLDHTCRNHGSCPKCANDRAYNAKRRDLAAKESRHEPKTCGFCGGDGHIEERIDVDSGLYNRYTCPCCFGAGEL